MRTLGHIWTAIKGIITLAITLAIFSVASTNFETIVLAILVLIYLSIGGFMAVYGLTQFEIAKGLDNGFIGLKRLILKDKKGDTDEEKEDKAETDKKVSKTMTDFYINAGFSVILYIIALFNLISAL